MHELKGYSKDTDIIGISESQYLETIKYCNSKKFIVEKKNNEAILLYGEIVEEERKIFHSLTTVLCKDEIEVIRKRKDLLCSEIYRLQELNRKLTNILEELEEDLLEMQVVMR